MYKAVVNVTLKKSVLDPQGKTVLHALHTLGFQKTKDMRVGRHFELTLDAVSDKEAQDQVHAMCDKLLINPVIEDYTFEVKKI